MIVDVGNFTDEQIKAALCMAIRELGFGRERFDHGRGSGSGDFGAIGAVEGQYRVAFSEDRSFDQSPERDQ
ncbi:MAG: hypothetical protein Q7U53_17470 [Anaerolineaceae bacterium]|nr:hypothetical protein [Anaerolineaceae bacterium]